MTFTQIVAEIDKNCKSNSVSYPLAEKVQDINNALSDALVIAFEAGGTWQFDDSNHTDYPIITTNLVSGDYSFTTDQEGNLILDIFKVMAKISATGEYQEINPVDAQTDAAASFYDGNNLTGIPQDYDKTANGFFLDPIPNYNATAGLKVYINREGSFFTTSDTTKKPGIDALCHEYLALVPSYKYARNNTLPNVGRLEKDVLRMEARIKDRYAKRERDVTDVMRAADHNQINWV
jgi:hypothetical protein